MPAKLEHPTARGGSSILKNQALCPFRAFASNRLGADGLETPVDGISAMLHGSLVHSVLEHFWIETRNQQNLLQLSDDELAERLRKHVDHVTGEDRGLDQRPAFRQVEAQRVYRHVMEFLALEKEREAFEVIGFEQALQPEILGQPIRLFIDRVDRLASGDEVIIDYKTGRVEPKKWFGHRPEDPQLPLYAISASQTPAAVVFGIIRDDGCLFKGVVKDEGLLPGLPPRVRSD
jgi:ATP-dependent helicase/DNAse subunit B